MQRASYCPKEKAAHVGCGYYRYKRRMAMTLDLSPPCKNETLKRNPRGEAVTKHLSVTCWESSVVNYWSLTSSGWLGDGSCQKAGGQTCWPGADWWPSLWEVPARTLWSNVSPEAHLPTTETGLFLSEWFRCSRRKAFKPEVTLSLIN